MHSNMKTTLWIIILLTVLYCVAGDGKFVTKEELDELKQIVGTLQKLYTNEKTQNDQLRRKCKDLEGTLKYVLNQLNSTQSRLSKLEHEMESTSLHAKTKITDGKDESSSKENYESELTGVKYKNTVTVKDPNENDQQRATMFENRNRPIMMQTENYPPGRLFRRNLDTIGSQRIAFSALDVADNSNLGYHQTIVFKTVLINEGNFYHPTTGVFSPSISGVYAFFYSIIVAPSVDLETALVKDGVEISHIFAVGVSFQFNQAGNMAVVHLNAGDNVWVRISTQHPASGVDIANIQNSFSGFLLYSDNN